ncbi:MAG: hypothetical protein COV59_04935 [Candidatus Magasanikbacteria bacterium CG11_big_fil_rev_8_21_14_0_20_39_34]|uniref:Nudix hydrolase domain-containing protein n=1 Tax=Candidatus Magasanikbacteria bacterium CG11_big_fil_rev_8_21_14_0_20_39_34 TaxID=1974653 RepID=A0A2H0N3M9_9BACT|nr:MAG: hypothetical protein COV59_04935 [Candidatus Magasanikbacteria bacterium CG11_big_fil_rev_8_21_14_0_20_39_34]
MIKKWKLISEKKNIGRSSRMIIDTRYYELPTKKKIAWDVRMGLGKVIIFALDKNGKAIIIRQFRPGISAIDTALVAGGIDEGLTPLQNAKKELEEEAGYISSQWIRLGKYATSAGNASGWVHSYLAMDCQYVGQNLEENEFIEVSTHSVEDVRTFIGRGKMLDSACVLTALLALEHLTQKKSEKY